MRKLRSHVVAELRTAKLYFISEHELFISFLDYTIDSSGLSTLIILYDYDRLYWFLVVLLELTVYAVFGAVLKQYTSWQVRNYILFCVNCVFGFLTYACNPYTEEKDRWYEFCGRVLVAIVAIGLVIYTLVSKDIIDGVFVPMYTPWRSFHFFTDLLSGQYAFSLGMVIDILTVIYFYFYLFYTLSDIGFFGVVDRMIQAFQFSYHDHVLDFLIDNLDQRSFGMENIFSGLEFVQQWDDVIKLQRRYALLAWPDIRPPQLISTSKKIFEVKWASLFNLTLKNLRSSLGLTILHITMFQGDGEVSRWIIHTNPDLLLIQDSQNDTPITIALKECAYYLMVYGEQNVGVLDDHTSYSDEDYAAYYPEVDDIRDEVFQTGEFMEELSIVTLLTAEDLVRLKEEGLYVEPKAIDYLKEEKFLKDRQMKSKTGYAMKFSNKNTYEESMQRKHDEELEKAIRLFKRKRKLLDAKHQNEKSSLVAHRFPEDDIYDNFESGQNSSWQILQFSVPLENVFIDKYLYQRYLQFPNYHYENHFHGRTAIVNTMKPRKSKKKSENNLSKNEFIDLEDTERNRFDESTDILDRFIDKDVQYVIPGNKAIHTLDNKVVIPLEDRLSSLANELPDWDRKLPRRNSSFSSERRDSVSGSVKSSNQSVHSDNSGLLNILTGSKQKQKNDRLANWKICKFAEILMSKEIRGACKDFRWDINDFKAFNKLASVNQGKIAQHLALVTRLNVPEGFVRLSDWSVGIMPDIYDERPEDDLNLVVKGIVALVTSVETAATAVAKMGDFFQVAVDVQRLRGRSKRSRSMRRSSKSHSIYASEKSGKTNTGDGVTSVHNREAITEGLLSDRVVQYLAETLVCSSPHLILDDCELSYNARRGWRAVARALRRRYCSFILPSVFMPPKPVTILSLILTRNELDCGDCVYMGDILMNQSQLRYLDLSYNRIGARGMNRMCKALKDHKCIETFLMQHNIMGPGCGHDIGLLLKATRSLKILNLAHNRLGEMVRFPTLLSREKLVSAAHDICTGLKYNKSIESLDLSYNHLGVTLGDLLPAGVVKHPKLNTLNIAGNDLGVQHGSNLVFLLAGTPLGAKYAKEKEQFIEFIQTRQRERLKLEQEINSAVHSVLMSESLPPILLGDKGESEIYGKETFVPTDSNLLFDSSVTAGVITEDSPALIGNSSSLLQPSVPTASSLISNGKVGKLNNEEENEAAIKGLTTVMAENDRYFSRPALNLTSLDVSNNQLGPFSGYAIAAAIEHMKGLTHLDVSGNSLGTLGADRITDALELCYGIRPREFIKTVLHDIEEKKYDPKFTRNAKKRKKRFTNLLSLNLSRNGIGPKVIGSLMVCCKSLNCTLIDLNVSDNPIGSNIGETSGSVVESAQLIRDGFMKNLSLISFNINRTSFDSTNLIAIFGGLAAHEVIQTICLSDIHMDEPCCLQLANVIQHCTSLKHLNLAKCKMGANGGVMICQKIKLFINRLEYLDLSENFVGPISAIYLAEALKDEDCKLRTLLMRSNDLMEAGGLVIAKSLIGNFSVTELDLSANHFTDEVAFYLADFARGLFKDGVKIRDSVLRKFMVNDNPMIGYVGAKLMVKSLANNLIDHFEISNIGAGPSTAEVVAKALRDPFIAWKNIKLSNNKLSRHGLNQIFWGMKNNKRLRILDVSENQAGTVFCSNEDALLSHGISVPVMLRNNVVLKELNLSYNTLVSEAGINIIDAIIDNHTIKKLSLRGNLLDDNIALILPDLLRCNNVLEELDIGYNRLGFASAYAIAESLEFNRSLKKLVLDYNSFGGSGTATLQCFMRSLMMNYSLQILNLDGNKLGPEWGKSFAETIVRNNTLIQFSLRDNRLDLASGSALLKAYKHNPYLIELALTSDEIGADLYEQFRQLFSNKRASIHPTAIDEETFLSPSQSALIATYHQFTHSSVQKKE